MRILGISAFFHDAAAALIEDGRLVAAVQQEAFSRKKHDPHFPEQAVEFCLKQGGVSAKDLDYVVFYEKPFVKLDRIMSTMVAAAPKSWRVFPPAAASWLSEKLWVRDTVCRRLGVDAEKVLFCDHHVSHAASAFFSSPFPSAAILTVDGVGEWATTSWGRASTTAAGSRLTLEEEVRFPHSLGLLYSAFTAYLGFEVNEGEYKVMGLAAYGKPRYEEQVRKVFRSQPDGSFELDLDYFAFHYSDRLPYSGAFEALFGPARDPKSSEESPELLGRYADVAASVQKVVEDHMVALAREVHKRSGEDRLCLAGGVAFNCSANRRLLAETPFKEIYIQPAAGDAGGALGAALYAHNVLLGQKRDFVMEHAYWGQEFTTEDAEAAALAAGLRFERLSEESLRARAVDALSAGKVVGWHDGRYEWGPRSLGHRSILADPRDAAMKETVNRKIKFREPFRPFAPAVLADKANDWFDLKDGGTPYPYRFMLATANVKESRRPRLGAATHADGTARVQTVTAQNAPNFAALLTAFEQKTGVPALLNTSFNLRGEPIVNTPAQALSSYMRCGMDAVRLAGLWIEK